MQKHNNKSLLQPYVKSVAATHIHSIASILESVVAIYNKPDAQESLLVIESNDIENLLQPYVESVAATHIDSIEPICESVAAICRVCCRHIQQT